MKETRINKPMYQDPKKNKKRFFDRYRSLFPDTEPERWRLKKALRINTLKIKEKDIINRLKGENVRLEKIDFLKCGYLYGSRFSLGSTPEYLLGYYFLQETSSQIPASVLDPSENDTVLDMCAAPGSKTTQIAQMMDDKGSIVALDKVRWRLSALRNNLERLGITNTLIYNKDARFVKDYKQKFDKILLDAPCTGNFLTDNKWFEKRSEKDVKDRAELQKELLKTAVEVLKDKGTMVYSTCSLEPEENELVIDWALRNLPVKLEKINIDVGRSGLTKIDGKRLDKNIERCLRILPDKLDIQPFFVAKLKKK